MAVFGLLALSLLRLWGSRPSFPLSAPLAPHAGLVALLLVTLLLVALLALRPFFPTILARHQEPLPLRYSRHLVRFRI